MKCYNAFTNETTNCPTTPTLHSLRAPAQYWVITDAQLARDLKGRTLADVYRENKSGRTGGIAQFSPPYGKYVPRTDMGSLETEYRAWCKARNHTPHPASIDSDHPMHAGQRERCPKREVVTDAPMIHVEDYWREAA